ncbi:MAG: hypothetical protein ACK4ML_10805 [Alishewanella aestuarii]
MTNDNTLIGSIQSVTDRYWQSNNKPLLLSGLPKLLATECPSYQDILGDRSLKEFINQTHESADYKLVTHPQQKAKIGIIPKKESYTFSDIDSSVYQSRGVKLATLNFLAALESLPPNEMDKVIIPTSVLIKLLK